MVTLVFALGVKGCESKTEHRTAAPSKPAPAVQTQEPQVTIEAGAGLLRIPVELATTHAQRQQGLMYRRDLKKGTGMLFIFEQQRVHRFWMKNTYIPLDMIFIGEDMTIAGIVHRATPETETARFVERPSRYVLEVNGGFAKAKGITPGDRVVFEGLTRPL